MRSTKMKAIFHPKSQHQLESSPRSLHSSSLEERKTSKSYYVTSRRNAINTAGEASFVSWENVKPERRVINLDEWNVFDSIAEWLPSCVPTSEEKKERNKKSADFPNKRANERAFSSTLDVISLDILLLFLLYSICLSIAAFAHLMASRIKLFVIYLARLRAHCDIFTTVALVMLARFIASRAFSDERWSSCIRRSGH